MNHIKNAIDTFEKEIQALENLKDSIDNSFNKACKIILNNNDKGRVIVTGMGKSGHIASKIAATLASTGTPSFFVHPAEAGHGDFGMITNQDVLISISNSGNSREIVSLLPMIKHLGIPTICITSNTNSTMAVNSDVVLNLNIKEEACPHNLAPTSSTTATLVLGDALAIALLKAKKFMPEDFAFSHPSGSLGKRLILKVKNIMLTGTKIPKVSPLASVQDAILEISKKGVGFTLITENNKLLGIFTDGDLRRVFSQSKRIDILKISDIMHKKPKTVDADSMAIIALEKMEKNQISSLVVTDDKNKIHGVINMHDLVSHGLK